MELPEQIAAIEPAPAKPTKTRPQYNKDYYNAHKEAFRKYSHEYYQRQRQIIAAAKAGNPLPPPLARGRKRKVDIKL